MCSYTFIKDINTGRIVGVVAWDKREVVARWLDALYEKMLSFELRVKQNRLTMAVIVHDHSRCMVGQPMLSFDDPKATLAGVLA